MQDLEIFLNAPKDASAEELVAYLDEACGSDEGLRQRVEELIAAEHSAENQFMDRPPVENTVEELEPMAGMEGPGDMVGSYKLLQKIGEGGFGEVWMAEQSEPIQRMVALKLVKAGMDTKLVLARFEAERQALAMMDHPNIAKVHEAGATAMGRPYFVMELVRGTTITEYCTRQRLGPRRRLELFRDVCSAVNHAHQKGIIHRDLKPSNVMVTLRDGVPVPEVISRK